MVSIWNDSIRYLLPFSYNLKRHNRLSPTESNDCQIISRSFGNEENL